MQSIASYVAQRHQRLGYFIRALSLCKDLPQEKNIQHFLNLSFCKFDANFFLLAKYGLGRCLSVMSIRFRQT